MRPVRHWNRVLPVLGLATGMVLLPDVARGQLAVQRSNQTFLILPPVPANPSDTAYAVELGDALRKKIDGKLRLKLNVVKKEKIAEALGNSGFPPNAILDENGASQLARFMNVDAYMTGRFEKNGGNAVLYLRLVDARRSGMSGWITIRGPATPLDAVVDMVADSVDQQTKAAELARDCMERKDKQEFGSAKDRADKAFRLYPNHPSTAMCLVSMNDMTKQPVDSQIAAYKRAVAGDSLLVKGWEGLSRVYQQKGDTAAWADAVIHGLAIDPTDMRKRLAAAELLYRLKKNREALELLDEGLDRSPGDPQASSTRLRYCFEGQLWGCSLQAMASRLETDSTVRNDSLVMKQLLATAGATNDPNTVAGYAQLSDRAKKYYQLAPDTAALMKWTGIAVQRFPNSVSFWKQRAVALKDAGKKDEALAAYRKIAELDPKDINSRIAAVQLLEEQLKIDSLTPLDTLKLGEIDRLLSQIASTSSDENIKMNVALLYFTPAAKMVPAKVGLDKAIEFLEKTKANDTKKQLTAQANFYEGLAYTFNLQTVFDFKKLQASKDCKQLGDLNDYLKNKLYASLNAGASVSQSTVDGIKKQLAGIDKFVSDAKTLWKCKF